MKTIDLNCDMGESFGAWTMGEDDAVLAFVSSANIACGFHGGDPATMRRTIAAAVARGVAVGAHPSLPDLAGFGRREMKISPADAYADVLYQIGALAGFARAAGTRLHHVKPHGALYNMAARDAALADAIAQAVRDFDRGLILVGLAGSELPRAGAALGLHVAHEAFADRRYENDGRLSPRGEPGAVVESADDAVAQAVSIAGERATMSRHGHRVAIEADTLCIHGDRADAALFARRIRDGLTGAGIAIAPLSTRSAA